MKTQQIQIGFEAIKTKTVGDLQAIGDSELLKMNFQKAVQETKGQVYITAEKVVNDLLEGLN